MRNPVRGRHAAHFHRYLPRLGAVVNLGQKMAVDVDHDRGGSSLEYIGRMHREGNNRPIGRSRDSEYSHARPAAHPNLLSKTCCPIPVLETSAQTELRVPVFSCTIVNTNILVFILGIE